MNALDSRGGDGPVPILWRVFGKSRGGDGPTAISWRVLGSSTCSRLVWSPVGVINRFEGLCASRGGEGPQPVDARAFAG